jgi:hypothetical protein
MSQNARLILSSPSIVEEPHPYKHTQYGSMNVNEYYHDCVMTGGKITVKILVALRHDEEYRHEKV